MELVSHLASETQDSSDISLKPTQNTCAFTIYFDPKQFIIEATQKGVQLHKYLVIDRQSGKVREEGILIKEGQVLKHERQRSFSAFLGQISILDKAFLLMAEEVTQVCAIDFADVFEIRTIQFVPFENEKEIYSSNKSSEILNIISNVRKLFASGFYFSYNYKLTLNKTKQALNIDIDYKFVWNNNLLKSFQQFQIDKKWFTHIIQGFSILSIYILGYVGNFSVYIDGKKLDFFLLSRRSSKRAGTRYNSRGIDDDGNVSNYVETEQIVSYNNYCCSFLIIRGSIPIFWQQRGYIAEMKITRAFELTSSAFVKHFNQLAEDYNRVIAINLTAKKKKSEQTITDAYEDQVKKNNLDYIKYEWFDFHEECKNSQFSKCNPLIRKLHLQNKNFQFYLENMKTKQINLIQRGVFRVNCIDCLDRTNFIQTKLAMDNFEIQMKAIGLDLSQLFKCSAIDALDEDNQVANNLFISHFKNIWADNGDFLSSQYTGTGSTHTNITRTGKRDFTGMLDHGQKSILRFYIQSFSDNEKQEAIDVLLGTHTDTFNVFTLNIEKELKAREKEYCEYSQRSIMILTWNLGGAEMPTTYDLNTQLIDNIEQPMADIIVVGLQEMMQTNQKYIFGNQKIMETYSRWSSLLMNNLNRKEKYLSIKNKDLMGLGIFVFAKDRLKERITKVSCDSVKLGFMGNIANKVIFQINKNQGAIAIKLYIDDTLLCFINGHLEHGQKSLNTRLLNVHDLHKQAFNTVGVGKTKEDKIEQSDYKFFFGDLNFRINLNSPEVINLIQKWAAHAEQNKVQQVQEIQKYLHTNDELRMSQKGHTILSKYTEEDITFFPTYKYEAYSSIYDKSRTPSWTDRILIWPCEGLTYKQLNYQRHEINYSDHRPVTAYFVIQTKRENKERKDQILSSIYDQDQALKNVMKDADNLRIDEIDEEENK